MTSLGCLIIHGWSANPDHVSCLAPRLEQLEHPCRMPLLRGHGTRPDELYGIRWSDWYVDVERALDDLLREASRAVVIGHSMGGLLALLLAARRPERIAGVVAVAAALRVTNPLFRFSPYLAPLVRRHRRNIATGYSQPRFAAADTTYRWMPASAVVQLYRLTAVVEAHLPQVAAPLLLIHSKGDKIVSGEAIEVIYRSVASREKQIVWFQRSGHEMFLDCEADAVTEAIARFIVSRRQEQPQSVV